MGCKFIKVKNSDDNDITIAIDHIILYRKLEDCAGFKEEVVQIKLTGGYQAIAKITLKEFEDHLKCILGSSIPSVMHSNSSSRETQEIQSNLNY